MSSRCRQAKSRDGTRRTGDGRSRSTRHPVKFPPTNTMRSCCRAARSIPTCCGWNRKHFAFIKAIFNQKKIVAAVCHGPWLLIETGIAKGRKMTSYKSIKTDVMNAGAKWEDSEVIVDQGVITSRNPGDLEAFSAKIIEEISEGRHNQRSAA